MPVMPTHRRAVAGEAIDLGRRFKPWATNGAVDPSVVNRYSGRRRAFETALAQRLGVGLREVDVDDLAIAAVEKSVLPAAGVIDQLMREHEIANRVLGRDSRPPRRLQESRRRRSSAVPTGWRDS